MRLKFNPLPEVLAGKRVVVVDDSIVRGTTTAPDRRHAAPRRRARGARPHPLAADAVPVLHGRRHRAPVGADRRQRTRLDEIRRLIGADSLGYLSQEGLLAAVGRETDGERRHCTACFDGRYPIDVPLDVDKFALERG